MQDKAHAQRLVDALRHAASCTKNCSCKTCAKCKQVITHRAACTRTPCYTCRTVLDAIAMASNEAGKAHRCRAHATSKGTKCRIRTRAPDAVCTTHRRILAERKKHPLAAL